MSSAEPPPGLPAEPPAGLVAVQRIARETAERAVREAEIGISEIELRDRVEASRR